MADQNMMKSWVMRIGRVMVCVALVTCHLSLITSCSEDNEVEGEFDNWQVKNETYVEKLAGSSLKKIKTYTKDQQTAGSVSDYIYVEVLENGSGTTCPLYTDTVRVAYRGHYMPTDTYADGLVFDQSYVGEFNWNTAGFVSSVAFGFVDGFTTALMNMHVGDRWRVYIPYALGYGSSSNNGVLAYSTLVFDLAMVDFWHPGETRPAFRSRER